MDRVSSCSREEGESPDYGRASARCGGAFAECGRVSIECSSIISFCRRVSDCGELESESDKLKGAEEGDIVKIWMRVACSV